MLLKDVVKASQAENCSYSDIRKEYTAKIADCDLTTQDKIRKLPDRVRPEEIEAQKLEIEEKFQFDKKTLEEEMEKEVEAIRNRKD